MKRALLLTFVSMCLLACKMRPPAKKMEWRRESVDPREPFVYGLHGSADDNVYALVANNAFRWDGKSWTATRDDKSGIGTFMHVAGKDDVWFAEMRGWNGHWDGKELTVQRIPEAQEEPIHASGLFAWPGEAWYFAMLDSYWRHDGKEWSRISPPAFKGWNIRLAWGMSPTDAWFVLESNKGERKSAVGRLENGTWRVIDHGSGFAVSGSSNDDVWFLETRRLSHWNGTKFTDSKPACDVKTLHVRNPTDAVAVGNHGCVLHWDGQSWARENVDDKSDFASVYISPSGKTRITGPHIFVREAW